MIRILVCMGLAAMLVQPATAHSHKRKDLEVVHPWTPETTQKDAGTARVYMTIKNSARFADRLVSASTLRGEKVELAASEDGGERGKAAAPFSIAPGKPLVLHAKGPHLVLTGLKKALLAYEDFKLVLVFEKAGRMTVDVIVEEAEAETDGKHRH
jgi:periplasmic copper chaperone A